MEGPGPLPAHHFLGLHMTCDLKQNSKNRQAEPGLFVEQDLILLPKHTSPCPTQHTAPGSFKEGSGRGLESSDPAPPCILSRAGPLKKGSKLGRSTCHHCHEAHWCSRVAGGCPAPDLRGKWVLGCG